MSKIVDFKGWKSVVEKGTYRNGATALSLIGAPGTEDEGEPIATASVSLGPESVRPGTFRMSYELPRDHCYIKTWSENEGMVEALVKAGIVEDTTIDVPVGPYGATARLVKIL